MSAVHPHKALQTAAVDWFLIIPGELPAGAHRAFPGGIMEAMGRYSDPHADGEWYVVRSTNDKKWYGFCDRGQPDGDGTLGVLRTTGGRRRRWFRHSANARGEVDFEVRASVAKKGGMA